MQLCLRLEILKISLRSQMINTPEPRRRRCPRWVTDEMWWTQTHESRRMMPTALWGQRSWEICDLKMLRERLRNTSRGTPEKCSHTLYWKHFCLKWSDLDFFSQSNWTKLSNESIKKKKIKVSCSGRKNWKVDEYQFPLKDLQEANICEIQWYRLLLALFKFQ